MKTTSPFKLILFGIFAINSLLSASVLAADDGLADRMKMAMSASDRPAGDADRDAGRKPDEVLAFLGVTSGMKVMDMMAVGGYYTEMLAAAVGTDGMVYSQNMDRMLDMRDGAGRKAIEARLANNRLPNTTMWVRDFTNLEVSGELDFAMLSLNIHDLYSMGGEASAISRLQSIKEVLKPGGVLGVIDHIGVADQDNKDLHRIEPDVAESLLIEAGFVIEARSDLLSNSDDDHTKNVFDPSVRGKTDRFIIRARN